MNTILVVDDNTADALFITIAVKGCLGLLNLDTNYEIVSASSVQQARECVQNRKPVLVVTDLFMPVDDFDRFEVRCDEIEFPHGLELLALLDGSGCRTLVTTFFWNYPGFSRYLGVFDTHSHFDGALPKDLFYLVGVLDESITVQEAWHFPPLRILLEAFWALLKIPRTGEFETTMNRLRFCSLFDEASNWLSVHLDHVLEIRNDIAKVSNDANERNKGPIGPRYDSDDFSEIADHLLVSPWMPSFVFRSPASGRPMKRGVYQTVMADIWDGNWSIDLDLSSALAQQVGHIIRPKWEGQKYGFHSRWPDQLSIQDFLTPRKPDAIGFAQILLTLGCFSYWCHLPDHRAALTSKEIAKLIVERGQVPYKREDNRDRGLENIAKQIGEDIEFVDYSIRKAIATGQRRKWWDFLTRNWSPAVIADRRDKTNDFRYWLNGSLVLRGRHRA